MNKLNPAHILLVEDNPADARLVCEALREHRILTEVHHVPDGEEALAFLSREPPYTDAPRPDLVFLDLNLPKVDGHQVLDHMKGADALRQIPVVVLTSSDADEDVKRAYEGHVNSYVTKPMDFDKFLALIQDLGIYWFSVVRLPTQAQGHRGRDPDTSDDRPAE
ncbi:MAG: response regulator [Candidatus Thermoplasmatota archaeon]|nr:response regulator [Candidatus Thermoplasmatota archaeon]